MNIGSVYLDKKTLALPIVDLLIICIACWYMFSGGISDNGRTIDQVRAELESARTELAIANGKLAESQSISEELKRTNITIKSEIAELARENSEIRELANSIGQINIELTEQINRGSDINNENLRLVRESQQGLGVVRETGQVRN